MFLYCGHTWMASWMEHLQRNRRWNTRSKIRLLDSHGYVSAFTTVTGTSSCSEPSIQWLPWMISVTLPPSTINKQLSQIKGMEVENNNGIWTTPTWQWENMETCIDKAVSLRPLESNNSLAAPMGKRGELDDALAWHQLEEDYAKSHGFCHPTGNQVGIIHYSA